MSLDRAVPPNPYDFLPARPWFPVTSDDFSDGNRLDDRYAEEHDDESPHLRWTGPDGTLSFVVTCFDPDAPTPGGWWHWVLVDLPPDTTELPRGSGSGGVALPGGAFHVRNDGGALQYDGPAPPPGDREHRYQFVVHAVDAVSLEVAPDASPAAVGVALAFRTIGRGMITGTWSR